MDLPDYLLQLLLHNTLFHSVLFVVVLSIFRLMHDNEEVTFKYKVSELALAGGFAIIAGKIIKGIGANEDWMLVVAGIIATLGVNKIRALSEQLIEVKLKKLIEKKIKDEV